MPDLDTTPGYPPGFKLMTYSPTDGRQTTYQWLRVTDGHRGRPHSIERICRDTAWDEYAQGDLNADDLLGNTVTTDKLWDRCRYKGYFAMTFKIVGFVRGIKRVRFPHRVRVHALVALARLHHLSYSDLVRSADFARLQFEMVTLMLNLHPTLKRKLKLTSYAALARGENLTTVTIEA